MANPARIRDIDEYLRRNMLAARAVGAHANASAALRRLNLNRRAPRWLKRCLAGIVLRTEDLGAEMARHRDEMGTPSQRAIANGATGNGGERG